MTKTITIKGLKLKAIVFDLDGTILDSCGIWKIIDENFFTKRGFDVPNDYSSTVASMGLKKASIYTKELLNLEQSAESIEKEWIDESKEMYKHKIGLKKNADILIKKLNEYGVIIGVATANSVECYEPCLKRNGIYDYFDFIVDVKSYKEGKSKPDIFLDIAKNLDLNPNEILIVEDSIVPVRVAKEAGFKICVIKEPVWPLKDEMEKRKIADIYIDDFGELL